MAERHFGEPDLLVAVPPQFTQAAEPQRWSLSEMGCQASYLFWRL